MSVAELLEGKRVCVCAGAGGVGKTTTSAAIALGMAARGARVAVVTIDPARRLADALGLAELANEPCRVAPERLALAGAGATFNGGAGFNGATFKGELWAMMLDPKRTFDELIDRLAPDPARAAEIKSNRVYRELSSAVSGSQEFTAVAKLDELHRDGGFDLLVLDTPPARNALDFLDAPLRLTAFLEGRALRAFTRPTGLGMRLLGRGAGPLVGALRTVTGVDLISDVTTFFSLLGTMTDEFSARAARVQELLQASSTAFVLVTGAQGPSVDEAIWFRRTLIQAGMGFAGVIANRVHGEPPAGASAAELRARLTRELGDDLAERVLAALGDHELLARRDARELARLRAELDGEPVLCVPHLDDDVHDIAGLLRVHGHLFAPATAGAAATDPLAADRTSAGAAPQLAAVSG